MQIKKRNRRKIAVLVCGLAAIVGWLLMPHEPTLLAKSKRVGIVNIKSAMFDADIPWEWGSDWTLVIAQQPVHPVAAPPQAVREYTRLEHVSILKGNDAPQPALDEQIAELYKQFPTLKLSGPLISPNGKWLLWDTPVYSIPTMFFAISSDGSKVLRWPKEPHEDYANELLWNANSAGWIRLRYSPDGIGLRRAELFDLGAARGPMVVSFPPNSLGGRLLGRVPDGRLLISNWWTIKQDVAYCALFDLGAPKLPVRSYSIKSPYGTEIRALALSPQGTRLAWSVYSKPPSVNGPLWLRRLRATFGMAAPRNSMELWLSRFDGSDMRRLGAIPSSFGKIGNVGDCRWSPNGKQLAFAYNHSLYVLSVN
jgi:hypothetical protein